MKIYKFIILRFWIKSSAKVTRSIQIPTSLHISNKYLSESE